MSQTLTLLLCAVGVALVACGDDDSDSGTATGSERAAAKDGSGCGAEVEPPAPKPDGGAQKPKKLLNPAKRYTEGVVAMAKTAVEPPGTSGSQFYIVTTPDAGLPPEYALLGKVVRGLEVVQAIGELGDPSSGEQGTPLRAVVIEGAKVRES